MNAHFFLWNRDMTMTSVFGKILPSNILHNRPSNNDSAVGIEDVSAIAEFTSSRGILEEIDLTTKAFPRVVPIHFNDASNSSVDVEMRDASDNSLPGADAAASFDNAFESITVLPQTTSSTLPAARDTLGVSEEINVSQQQQQVSVKDFLAKANIVFLDDFTTNQRRNSSIGYLNRNKIAINTSLTEASFDMKSKIHNASHIRPQLAPAKLVIIIINNNTHLTNSVTTLGLRTTPTVHSTVQKTQRPHGSRAWFTKPTDFPKTG